MQLRTTVPPDATLVVRAADPAQGRIFAAGVLIGAVVALGGVLAALGDPASPIAWGLLAVGVAICVYTLAVRRRQKRGALLAADTEHVWFRIGGRTMVGVPWEQVTALRTSDHHGYWFVCVDADETAAELERGHPAIWRASAMARGAHATPFALSDHGKDTKRTAIMAGLRAARPAPAAGE